MQSKFEMLRHFFIGLIGCALLVSAPASGQTYSLSEPEARIVRAYEQAAQSIVAIEAIGAKAQQTGAGVIGNTGGLLATNLHVVARRRTISVTLPTGVRVPADLVGADPIRDIAVLKINVPAGESLRSLPLGDSSKAKIGQSVLAIGNPFGFSAALSRGIISGLHRTVALPDGRSLSGLLQTDASINPGNSGGALLDGAGQPIGITMAIISPSGSSAGLGFALPAEQVNIAIEIALQKADLQAQAGSKSKQSRAALGIMAKDAAAGVLSRM